ncbi:GNAT family N-acetyltransferase [Acidithiobacillus ferriphilus]|uniref:GNAT family N-acetyltransferase n=1 Tax=Acidithiobacillus ferriphilus TaxID=1689834 RepID=UPI001C0612DC|nr:GNAT family N-acetyltransferase [Acidithiobacillus ferriphilus]MBU2784279.1 GNAT family N-acetyltransferase [Acidithiobacillus ferriphilus]MBU2845961.1 GNAT family N-acetyltransferase [Acidithiobacillus ferriphilus]UEP58303.1 GNAT family N-acetyltransferase [Acidithiobacillus ferriphilus]
MRIELYDSITKVPRESWNRLARAHSETLSWEFWQVIERSGLNDFAYRHAMLLDEQGEPQAITSFYSVTTDIAIFAPPGLRVFLTRIRRWFPNFLKLRMLEWGSPVTINSPPFARSEALSDKQVIEAMDAVLRRTARAEGHFLIVVRDFEPNAQNLRSIFRRRGYHWTPSLPNTYMEIRWSTPEQYWNAMRSYYRSKLKKYLNRNQQADVHHRLVDDFENMAEILHHQWMVVHQHAKEFQRETLTPTFYGELARTLEGRAKVILFYRGEALVGHALLLVDGDMLRWLYVGRAEAENDGLYIYIAHQVVVTAIALGVKRLEMGLTTYPIKQDLGAEVTPIFMALRAASGWINPFVGLGYALLNHVPQPNPRPVFKTTNVAA